MSLGMKKHMMVAGIAAGAIVFGAYSIQGTSDSTLSSSCTCQESNALQYQPNDKCANQQVQQSWFAWLTGDSRSAQFHYLDLLELLSRDDSKNTRQFSSNSY